MESWADYYGNDLSVSEFLGNLNAHGALFDAILAESPKAVLEVGVGTGIMGLFLSQWGPKVTGLDNDAEVLRRAAELAARFDEPVEFIEGDAFDLVNSVGDKRFDVAFSQGFFEHFDDESIRALVTQQLEVAPTVIFSVPGNGYGEQDFGNERLMPPQRWCAILDGIGIVDAHRYGNPGLRPKRMLRVRVLGQAMHDLVTVRRAHEARPQDVIVAPNGVSTTEVRG